MMETVNRSVTLADLRARTDRDLAALAEREVRCALVQAGCAATLDAAEAAATRIQHWVRYIELPAHRAVAQAELTRLRFVLAQARTAQSARVMHAAMAGAFSACSGTSRAAS